MINKILTTIAMSSPYNPMELKKLYEKVKSVDLVLSAINLSQKFNISLDEASKCIIVSEVMKNYE